MSRPLRISRRTVLRGLGATLALPWLEAMQPLSAGVTRAGDSATDSPESQASRPPLRLMFVFVPGGVNLEEWTPRGEGADYEPSATLRALEPVRSQVLVLSGLNSRSGEAGGNGHPLGCAPWLSSAPLNERDTGGYCTDISVDQIAARHVGGETRLPSIELGCDQDSSQLHTSNISWRGPGSPMGKETDPRAVFSRLLADPRSDADQRSILDVVLEDARSLRQQLGRIDRLKLDEYLDSVRAVERRIEFAERHARQHRPPQIDLPEAIPDEYGEHVRLLSDLVVLGLRTDATRVATFMYNNEPGRRQPWTELGINEGHHELAHLDPRTQDGKQKLEKLQRIDRYYLELFVHMLGRLRDTPEGDGTLLDNSMIVYGSGLAWGRLHNRENVPVLLAGGGGGTIDGGRHVRHRGRPLADLYLALLERMGVTLDRVADSTGPLPQLSA
ncbi:MAG TPA: DUF1552 domain-containing protein [Planctomycetaceae bacterium]|nr:DUF1552 domain-containing protein [Planctomycetaceae bacterium]